VIGFNYVGMGFMLAILLALVVTCVVLSYVEGRDERVYMSKDYMYKHYSQDNQH